MDKLEFTDWSQVNWMFGCGEIAIFRQRMMFAPPPALTRVKKKVYSFRNTEKQIGILIDRLQFDIHTEVQFVYNLLLYILGKKRKEKRYQLVCLQDSNSFIKSLLFINSFWGKKNVDCPYPVHH